MPFTMRLGQWLGTLAGHLGIGGRGNRHVSREIQRSGAYWDSANQAASGDVLYWLAVPMLAQEINRRTTGDPHTWPLTAFGQSIKEYLPVRRGLSIGCGTGSLEREVAKAGAASHIDGIDVGEGSIQRARELAAGENLDGVVHYHVTDAVQWLRRQAGREPYDLIFFHGSLHHIEALEGVLDLCASRLRGGSPGFLYIDEYVGPSREEWRPWHVAFANGLFGRIPEEHRRLPEVAPPIAWEDPTEMIRSSEIVPLIRERFVIIHERPYYGNVLFPLVSAVKGCSLVSPDVLGVLEEGIGLENYLIGRGVIESMYTVLVGRPKEG